MKVRNGFVSNSSSSSFVLGVPLVTKDIKAYFKEQMGARRDSPSWYAWDEVTENMNIGAKMLPVPRALKGLDEYRKEHDMISFGFSDDEIEEFLANGFMVVVGTIDRHSNCFRLFEKYNNGFGVTIENDKIKFNISWGTY